MSRKAALAPRPDWRGMIETARARFPEAEIRILFLPREEGGLIGMRMRQPEEWLPNGRTLLWFTADGGTLVDARDSRALAPPVRLYGNLYSLHAARVGGLPLRLVMTLSGLALMLLGSLAV